MTCPKCKGENVNIDVKIETKLKKKHSVMYWLFIGWWLNPLLWIFLTMPMLIVKIFKPKNYTTKTIEHKMCICQSCGYKWEI
jgi:hypothetical protein